MKKPEVRDIELSSPELITASALRRWTDDFSLPTIVRRAFIPPELDLDLYLPGDTPLFANLDELGGFNHTGNGSYRWAELWSAMGEGRKVYGAFGSGTNNMSETILASVLRFKQALVSPKLFPLSTSSGHVIFGASDELRATTGWHCAIGANLVFQFAGQKRWCTSEQLPSGYTPLSIDSFVHGVADAELYYSEDTPVHSVSRGLKPSLYDALPELVLEPGDLLINPPYSWHAVKIDQRSVTLSLRGDRNDSLVWLGYRYFDGNFEHPLFVSLCNFFWAAHYIDEQPPISLERPAVDDRDPNRMAQRFFARAKPYREQRRALAEYVRQYQREP